MGTGSLKPLQQLLTHPRQTSGLARAAQLDSDDPGEPDAVEVECLYDINSLLTRCRVANHQLGAEETRWVYDGHYRVRRRSDAVGTRRPISITTTISSSR